MKALSGKPKKCKACRVEFVPARPLQVACGLKCALDLAKKASERTASKQAKEERKASREARERVKTKAQHMKEVQTVFNAWVRARDAGLPCISCGTTADVQYAAGHYRTTAAAPELRFEPLNVHLQCNRNCNMGKSGNLLEYRIGLINRIGLDKVEWLEGMHEPKRYTIPELQAIKAHYREKLRELQKKPCNNA